MQKRENYLYVGMDLHKDTHTAVLVNCLLLTPHNVQKLTVNNAPNLMGVLT